MKKINLNTLAVMLIWVGIILTAFIYGAYNEIEKLTDGVPNNTWSHTVAILTEWYPWLPYATWGFFLINVLFWPIVFLHWWKPGFIWKAAVFVDEDKKIEEGEKEK